MGQEAGARRSLVYGADGGNGFTRKKRCDATGAPRAL